MDTRKITTVNHHYHRCDFKIDFRRGLNSDKMSVTHYDFSLNDGRWWWGSGRIGVFETSILTHPKKEKKFIRKELPILLNEILLIGPEHVFGDPPVAVRHQS